MPDTPDHAAALAVLSFIDKHHPKIRQTKESVVLFTPEIDRIVEKDTMREILRNGWIEELTGPGSEYWGPSDAGYAALAAVADKLTGEGK